MKDSRTPQTVRFDPGFFTETSARGAPTRWKSGDRVRFRNGELEKLGGWVAQPIGGYAYLPDLFITPFQKGNYGAARRMCEWTALDGESFIAVGTSTKLFLLNRNTRYNITPLRRTVTVLNPIHTTLGSIEVTITDPGHGANVGDCVFIPNSVTVGGRTFSGEYVVQSVLGNTYVIHTTSGAASTATGGGQLRIEYEISIGTITKTVGLGYSAGAYGRGTWGTARATSNIPRPLRIWSLDNFGEDLICSPRGGAVYHWDRTNGVQTRAVILDQAPQTNEAVLISNSGGRIICLGAFDEASNTPDKMFIRVGAEGSLTDFTPPIDVAQGTDTFEQRLSTGSRIVGGVRTAGGNFVSTDRAVYMMFEDPSVIYSIQPKGTGNPAISPQSMLQVDGTVYVMTPTKFMVYDGVYAELPCDVWRFVFLDATTKVNLDQADMVHSFYNERFAEIWWFYPSGTNTQVDRYVVFNKTTRTWITGTLQRTCALSPGVTYSVPFLLGPSSAGADDTFYLHETGQTDNGHTMTFSAETHDWELRDGLSQQHVSRAIMDMTEMTGALWFRLRAKERPMQTNYVSAGPYRLLPTTTKSGTRLKGRQCALRVESYPENVSRFTIGTDGGGTPKYGAGPGFGTILSTSFPPDPMADPIPVTTLVACYSQGSQFVVQISTNPGDPILRKNFFAAVQILPDDESYVYDTLQSAAAAFSVLSGPTYQWAWTAGEFGSSDIGSTFRLRFDDSRDTYFRLATSTLYLQPDSEE